MKNLLKVLATAFLGACAIPTFITVLWVLSIGSFNIVEGLQEPFVIMLNGIIFMFSAFVQANELD